MSSRCARCQLRAIPGADSRYMCGVCGWVHWCGKTCSNRVRVESEGHVVCSLTGQILSDDRISVSYHENVSTKRSENGGYGVTCTGYAPPKRRRREGNASNKLNTQLQRIAQLITTLFLSESPRRKMKQECDKRIEQVFPQKMQR